MSPRSWDTNTVFIRELGGILLPLCGPREVRSQHWTLFVQKSQTGTWSLRSDFPLEKEANAKFILKVFLVYLKLGVMKNPLRVTYSHNIMCPCFLQNKPLV